MSSKKLGRHDRMMAALDSSSDDEPTTAVKSNKAIKPTATPIPTVGKKKAQQAAVEAFGAALGSASDSDDSFDKPVMAKAAPKPHSFKGYNPAAVGKKESNASKPAVADTKKKSSVAAALNNIETSAAMATSNSSNVKQSETKKKNLFDDEDDDDAPLTKADTSGLTKKALASVEVGAPSLTVNRSYADRYDAVKRKQELQKLADKFKEEVEESDETDEEEDEFGDELNDEAHDAMLAEVLFRLRQNDPTIKDKSVGFFKDLDDKTTNDEGNSTPKDKEKRYTLKDEYQRAIEGGESYDEGANANIEEDDRPGRLKPRTNEERKAKAAFLNAIGGGGDDEDDALIVKKVGGKSSAELFGASDGSGKKKTEKSAQKNKLAQAFSTGISSAASKEEQQQEAFLQSFFLNEKWREDGDDDSEDEDGEYTGGGINRKGMKKGDVNWEQLAKEDQDELFFDEAEQWEREFQNKQFHHEMVDNPEDLQVKSFARRTTNIQQASSSAVGTLKSIGGENEEEVHAVISGGDGLLRKHESSRKEQRRRKAERAAEAEAQRLEELKRLKTLKRMEIEEKRDMIARVAGFLKGGTTANTNDASLDNFDLENPFAANSIDPKDQNKKKKNKKNTPAPAEGNQKLLAQLSSIWTNEELEKDFDSADFDKKMAALFDTDEFNNDIDEEEIAKIRAEIEDDDINFGEGADDDEDAEELAEKLLHEEVGVGYGDEEAKNGDGLFFSHATEDGDGDDDDESDGILDDAELFGGLQGVMNFEKKKTTKGSKVLNDDTDDLYGASSSGNAGNSASAADEDDDLTALLYPSAVLSKMEKEKAEKTKEKKVSAVEISKDSKKKDLEEYLKVLQKDLDTKVDEYDKLHYDKVLSGGLKTRFRYRTVPAESFGLSDEDILTKDDRTLNMIAPMKLYAAYLGPKENKRDRQRCIARMQNLRKLDPSRRSRKYGDVSKTILFDPNVPEEEGKAMAARVRLSTKKLLASNEAEDIAVNVEKELKEDRKAAKAIKSKVGEKRPRETQSSGEGATARNSQGEEGQPPTQRKPFEGRGGFRGRGQATHGSQGAGNGRGRGSSTGHSFRGGHSNNRQGSNFVPRGGNSGGRGFSSRGRGQ